MLDGSDRYGCARSENTRAGLAFSKEGFGRSRQDCRTCRDGPARYSFDKTGKASLKSNEGERLGFSGGAGVCSADEA